MHDIYTAQQSQLCNCKDVCTVPKVSSPNRLKAKRKKERRERERGGIDMINNGGKTKRYHIMTRLHELTCHGDRQ